MVLLTTLLCTAFAHPAFSADPLPDGSILYRDVTGVYTTNLLCDGSAGVQGGICQDWWGGLAAGFSGCPDTLSSTARVELTLKSSNQADLVQNSPVPLSQTYTVRVAITGAQLHGCYNPGTIVGTRYILNDFTIMYEGDYTVNFERVRWVNGNQVSTFIGPTGTIPLVSTTPADNDSQQTIRLNANGFCSQATGHCDIGLSAGWSTTVSDGHTIGLPANSACDGASEAPMYSSPLMCLSVSRPDSGWTGGASLGFGSAGADFSGAPEVIDFAPPPVQPEPTATSSDNSKNSGKGGDPVDTFTGELYASAAPDLSLGGPMPLYFQRHYASNLRKDFILGDLGSNWLHNFDARLLVTGNTAIYIGPKGRVTKFSQGGSPPVWNQITNLDTPYQLTTGAGQDAALYDPASSRVYTFDYTTSSLLAGKLVKVEDGHGRAHSVNYDPASGQLASIADDLGRTLTFTYNTDPIPKIETLSDGTRTVIYEYTDAVDTEVLTRVTDPRGGITTYSYADTSGVADHALLLSERRPEFNVPLTQTWYDTSTPDASGRVATQTDANGNTTTFAYDPQGTRKTTITDALGNTSVHTHTVSGELSTLQDEQGLNVLIANNVSGQRTGLTDREGGDTTYTYHSASGKLASVTNAEGNTTSFTHTGRAFGDVTLYDLTGIAHADGTTEAFAYDSLGRMTSHTDQIGGVATATYDANGRALTETNRAGGTITNTYDGAGRLGTTTSPAGDTTAFTYDALGRPSTITLSGGVTRSFTYDAQDHPLTTTDENGNTVTMAYDDNGNLVSVQNPLLQALTIAYDDNDRPISATDPLGNTTSQTFDALGRLGTETDANGNTTTYGYDTRSRLASITAPGGQKSTFAHDDEGVLASRTTPLDNTTTLLSDSMGRITQTTTPTGRVYQLTYDPMGRTASRVGPLGNTTTLSRDERGLLTGVTLPGGVSTTYARNALGNITSITDPNGNEWKSTFDNGGRRTSDVDPLGNTTAFTYDNRARTSGVTYPGTMGTSSMAYDPAGNLASTSWSDGTTHTFAYDDANRLTGATGVSLAYDAAGRLTSSNGIALTRDAGGRVTAMTLAVGKTVTYSYDANDRVTTVTDWAGGTTTLTWNDENRLTGMTRPNGVNATFTYDADGYLLSISEGALSAVTLVRDPRGNITSATRTVPTAASATAVTDETHSYDAASRLADASHDEFGRMTANGDDTYTWNLASHLTGYTRGGVSANATYDAAGQCLSRSIGGTTRSYVWNAGLSSPAISVERQGGTDLNYYVHLPNGRLLYRLAATDDARSFYHFDEMGNTLYLTDDGGDVTASYAYSPFGRLLDSAGALDNPFTWQGQHGVMTAGNDLYYMRARYYDGKLGRFLSRDAARSISPMGINPYQYANANPLRYVDRTGLTPEDVVKEKVAALQRKVAQTVYIYGKGPEAGMMAFAQFLTGMDMRDILRDKPQGGMTPVQLDPSFFDPPDDQIESVVPDLAPIVVVFGHAHAAGKAYLPRQGQETKNVETSARDAVVNKGVLGEIRFSDPLDNLLGKGGINSLLGPQPAPATDSLLRPVTWKIPAFQIEQVFRAFFDMLLMPWGLDSGIFDPVAPPPQNPDQIESVVPELADITVLA